VKVLARKLLANDWSQEDLPLLLTGVSATSAQGAWVEIDGPWIFYLPSPGMTESDTFTYTIEDTATRPATGTVTVLVRAPQVSQARNLLTIAQIPGTQDLRLRFSGLPGADYRIETSTDLQNWTSLGSVQAGPNGIYEFIHLNGQDAPQRFYRSARE
jgi:hypothetical protein